MRAVILAYLHRHQTWVEEYMQRMSKQATTSLESVAWVEGEMAAKKRMLGLLNFLIYQCTPARVKAIIDDLDAVAKGVEHEQNDAGNDESCPILHATPHDG